MVQKERLEEIRQIVKRDKKVVVSELGQLFGVTDETIRRDLEKLENEGLVVRTYGGAVLNVETISEHVDFLRRAQTNTEEKRIIGELAASVIPAKVTIGADASSTVMEAISVLRDRSDITVLTNSVKIIRELDQADINILSTGGLVNSSTYSMQGIFVRRVLQVYNVDIVLLSCKALGVDGVYDSNEEEAELKKLLIDRGQKIILLADHTKFDKIAFAKLLDVDMLDIVITDEEPSDEWKALLAAKKVQVMYPGWDQSEKNVAS